MRQLTQITQIFRDKVALVQKPWGIFWNFLHCNHCNCIEAHKSRWHTHQLIILKHKTQAKTQILCRYVTRFFQKHKQKAPRSILAFIHPPRHYSVPMCSRVQRPKGSQRPKLKKSLQKGKVHSYILGRGGNGITNEVMRGQKLRIFQSSASGSLEGMGTPGGRRSLGAGSHFD